MSGLEPGTGSPATKDTWPHRAAADAVEGKAARKRTERYFIFAWWNDRGDWSEFKKVRVLG